MRKMKAKTDTIYRADAIEAVKRICWNCSNTICHNLINELSTLPSAEAVQGWIPCSERLPSYDGHYLVCMAWEYDNVAVLKWADGWNCYRDYDGKISRESEIDGADIIAWMPLPKPYKGGDDE